MKINSDINILGGLPDFNLMLQFLNNDVNSSLIEEPYQIYTSIKTDKSVQRFKIAINGTFLKFKNKNLDQLITSILKHELISHNSLLVIFWNASFNNDLLNYLNTNVFFPGFYSGRLNIKRDEVSACIKELKETELTVKGWKISTIDTVSSKYLTLLKKFNLMEGKVNKTVIHPYLNDKMFLLFIYWLKAIENKPNILESVWLKYSFLELPNFIERILQKKFIKYFDLIFTGDKLLIDIKLSYLEIYDAII